MNRLRRCCLAILAIVACGPTLRAADAQPLVAVGISDGQRLIQHWQQGPIGTAWQDPGVAALRARLDEEWPSWVAMLGCDPLTVLQAARHAGLRVTPAADSPVWLAQADVGDQADALFALIAAQGELTTVPGADAAATIAIPLATLRLIRHGTWLQFGTVRDAGMPHPLPASAHDLTFHCDGPGLIADLSTLEPADRAVCQRLLPLVDGTLDVTAQGFAAQAQLSAVWPWLAPLDAATLGRLPATTTEVAAAGIDGAVLWREGVAPLLQVWARHNPAAADHPLHELGVELGWQELVTGLSGTWVMSGTPGTPIPGFSLFAPRSASTDQVVTALLTQLGTQPPAEGQSMPLSVPNIPVLLNLARDAGHWLLTTDPTLSQSWLGATAGQWTTSPLGTVAAGRIDAATVALNVTDTPSQVQQLVMWVNLASALKPVEKQAAGAFINRLAHLARPSWLTAQRTASGLRLSGEGLPGGQGLLGMSGVIAAIAIPNLLESRSVADEVAAAAVLKSGIFPSQIQFQAGAYIDRDHDGRGEYAPELALLAGKTDAVVTRPLSLLPPDYNAPQPVRHNGYCFATYTFGESEENFVAYAWPEVANHNQRCFAMTITGQVYTRAFAKGDAAPGVFALWGDRPAESANTPVDAGWQPYRR